MDANKVLEVMLVIAPQLLPTLDSDEPDYLVNLADGGSIDTHDDEDRSWAIVNATDTFYREDIKTEEELREAIADYVLFVAS